jgi:enoyl-[acyl-carrier protein] reductase II
MHPQLFDLIAVCGKHAVSHIVLAGGLPPKGALEAIKETGAKVICFAPALALAKKFMRSGVDALVIEGSEAGGHIGPVATSVLAQEILPEVCEQVPVFRGRRDRQGRNDRQLSGNGCGRRATGHALCLRDRKHCAPRFQKSLLPRQSARDAIASVQIDPRLPVIPVRALKNKGTEEFTAKQIRGRRMLDAGEKWIWPQAQLEIEAFLGRRAAPRGDRR